MRFLFYTDLHAADQTPRSRTGDYTVDILAKLREIITWANEYEVDYLINGADTFDRKSPWRVSHRLVRQMIEIMSDFDGRRHLTIIGTHDVPTGQLQKLPQQPLGILQEAGVITVLEPQHFVNGVVRYPDPKQSGTGESSIDRRYVMFHPVPASYDLDKDPQNYAVEKAGQQISTMHDDLKTKGTVEMNPDDSLITIAHGMVVPPGNSFFGDYTTADQIADVTQADIFLYGHPHTPDGIYLARPEAEDRQPLFIGPGSISRRDSSPYNRSRIPQVVLFETPPIIGELPKCKKIPLTVARPPEEVFAKTIADEEDENARDERVEAFVRSLADTSIKDDSWGLDQLLSEIRGSEAEEDVRQVAEQILEEVAR